MSKIVSCSRCRATFNHRMKLKRHKEGKCQFVVSPPRHDYQQTTTGKYQCKWWLKEFKHQSSATRHAKENTCRDEKVAEEHKCHFCDKVFQFKSYLTRHLRAHKNDVLLPSFAVSSGEIV